MSFIKYVRTVSGITPRRINGRTGLICTSKRLFSDKSAPKWNEKLAPYVSPTRTDQIVLGLTVVTVGGAIYFANMNKTENDLKLQKEIANTNIAKMAKKQEEQAEKNKKKIGGLVFGSTKEN
jgi:hypothetical protein